MQHKVKKVNPPKPSPKNKKIGSKTISKFIEELEKALSSEVETKDKEPPGKKVGDYRSFKGYPPDTIRYPKDILTATMNLSEASTNASLGASSKSLIDESKLHIGKKDDPTDGILSFLGELKAFVRTSQKSTRNTIAWIRNYSSAYSELVEKIHSGAFKNKSETELVNLITEFVGTAQKA